MVGLPDAWGGWARDLAIRFEAGIDVSLDLADGAAMADARSMLPGISKADRRATATLAMKLAAPTPVETRMRARNPGQRDGAHAAHGGSQPREHRRPVQALGRPRGGRVLGLVRDVPALRRGRPAEERNAAPGAGTASRPSPRWGSAWSTCPRSIRSAPRIARARTTSPNAAPAIPGAPGRSAPAAGGHTAIHPDLGTLADFDALRRRGGDVESRGRARLCAAVQSRTTPG